MSHSSQNSCVDFRGQVQENFESPQKARRNSSNADQDLAGKEALQRSEKDRSENVMVVDLVRNDLSRVCEEGTVKVDELIA